MTNETVQITKEMLNCVTSALTVLIKKKGDMNKMVSIEDIENYLLQKRIDKYVPVTLCLRALIDVKYVRYFKMESGKLVFGYTKLALERMSRATITLNREDIAL